MEAFLKIIMDNLNKGNYLSVSIIMICIIILILVFHYKKIIEYFEERKKININNLNKALECSHVKESTRYHLQDELATEYFKIVTGVRMESTFREAVLQAYNNTKGELPFIHFIRSLPYLYYKDSSLIIKISYLDKIINIFYQLFGILFASFGTFILVVLLGIGIEMGIETEKRILYIFYFATVIMSIAIGFFMLNQTFAVDSAKKVQSFLEQNSAKSTQSLPQKEPQPLPA